MTFAVDQRERAKYVREKRLEIAAQLLSNCIRLVGTSEVHSSTINACLKGAEELIKRNEERSVDSI